MSRRAAILRALAVAASAALAVVLVSRAGLGPMRSAILRAGRWSPLLLLLELGIVALNAWALDALYRAAGRRAPARAVWRATYLGNLGAVCLPAGRVLAEGWKAARLSLWTGGPVAASGAVGLQASVLLGNATIALVTLVGVAARCGRSWPTLVVGVFTLAMTLIGGLIVLAGRARLGRWLGDRFTLARVQGAAFDEVFAQAARALPKTVAIEGAARALQLGQVAVLLHALGHTLTWSSALATHGIVLTGAALGDLLPAQIGGPDALLTTAAPQLDLTVPDALTLTLGLHGAQVGAALVGAAFASVWPDTPLVVGGHS